MAARQHSVVSHAQLLALGMSAATIHRWVFAGHLHVLHRGVYAVGHRRIIREGEWMAAVLACGEGAVLSHGGAAQLWSLIKRYVRGVGLHVSVPGREAEVAREVVEILAERSRGGVTPRSASAP